MNNKMSRFRTWKKGKIWLYGSILFLSLGLAGNVQGIKVGASTQGNITIEKTSQLNFNSVSSGVEHIGPIHTDAKDSNGNPVGRVYCLDEEIPLNDGATATPSPDGNPSKDSTWTTLNPIQKFQVQRFAFLSMSNSRASAQTDDNMYYAAQLMIWNVIAGKSYNDIRGASVGSGNISISQIQSNIEYLYGEANKLGVLPSFAGQTKNMLLGTMATFSDSNGVLSNFPNFTVDNGFTTSISGNNLIVYAQTSNILGTNTVKFDNNGQKIPDIWLTQNVDSTPGQNVVTQLNDPYFGGSLSIKVIGLGEVILQKTSTNNAFNNSLMTGAEFTLYNTNDTLVKWTDGHNGYPITATDGTKSDNTNVVLKMGIAGKWGVKNLDFAKDYYLKETKAPAGFAMNSTKIPISFDENSKFDTSTNNYQDNVNTRDIPTGSFTLTKVDEDTGSNTTQGEATLKGVTYGLFNTDDTPVKWSDGLNASMGEVTEDLPLSVTSGTKADNTNVEISVDDKGKLGAQNLPLRENKKDYYLKETRTSSGYSQSTKKIPLHFDGTNTINVTTNDFDEQAKAMDKVNVFSFMFTKAQEVNGSLTGLNGAEFTLAPQEGTQGNPIVATSGTGTDSNGYTINGLTVFDGKANALAGNPNKDGIAIGRYTLYETKTPNGLISINPMDVVVETEADDKGIPLSYTATFTDTVTKQEIDKIKVDALNLVNNNVMFKVNLGTFTDKLDEKPKPEITTTATDKSDGDKILGVGQAQVTDLAIMTNVGKSQDLTLTGKVVYKGSGEEVKDKDGNTITATQDFTSDENGDASVRLDFPLIDTSGDQNKEYTLLEQVTDKDGYLVVEENNYKNNVSQSVKVDKADGHTEVQSKELEVDKDAIIDKFFYEGLVKGDTYTVEIKQAYDHDLKKIIPVEGSLTFKATDTSGTVDVPVKVDGKKYAGHKITFYADVYLGEKPSEKDKPIISRHDKDDEKETFTVKTLPKVEKPKVEKPKPPVEAKLPSTGEEKAAYGVLAGIGLLVVALAIAKRDEIKAFFNKNK